MGTFSGYYIEFKKNNSTWQFPLSKMKIQTLEIEPYKVMDLDPYYDATGLLHRNIVSHTSAVIKFNTPVMSEADMESLMTTLQSFYTDTKARNCTLKYWDPEHCQYTGYESFYMAEPKFKPMFKNAKGVYMHDEVTLEFIKY